MGFFDVDDSASAGYPGAVFMQLHLFTFSYFPRELYVPHHDPCHPHSFISLPFRRPLILSESYLFSIASLAASLAYCHCIRIRSLDFCSLGA